MSILVEIAEKADVSVEGVVRVLTREPVSDAIKERVLAVLDDLTPEQTRAVQRFALAALHDVLGRSGDPNDEDAPQASSDQLELALAGPDAAEPDRLPLTGPDAALVQLSSVLGELAEAVRDLRRETDAERRERVDDLAVLIDLITTGWQGLDSRLGRIERQVSRLETGRREPAPALVSAPAPAPPVDAAPAVAAPPPASPARREGRDRLPLAAALSFVAAGVVTLAVLQLASGGPDVERLVSSRETATDAASTTPAETRPAAAATTAPARTTPASTRARPPAAKPPAPATTSSVLGTTVARPAQPNPSATTTTAPRPKPLAPATTPAATTAAAPSGFQPTRNWAWAPVQGADYYSVEFSRGGASFYRASPTEARLALPSSVAFRPGSYRWVVRPGFGDRAAKNLGAPVVDSPFTVSG